MKSVSIIGMGWLGIQMAKQLEKQAYKIKGTSRSKGKIDELSKNGWQMEQLDLLKLNNDTTMYKRLFSASIIILTIPPSSLKTQYATAIDHLLQKIVAVKPEVCLFYTSSTSVYGNYDVLHRLDEYSELNPLTINAKEIVKVEKQIAANFENYCILRLGGLFGKGKNPVKYLAGRKNISKPQAPINLIHAEDICRFMIQLLRTSQKLPKVINLVAPEHPLKKDFYQAAAEQMAVTIPEFDEADQRKNKKVETVVMGQINFNFKFPSPKDFPELNFKS